MKKIFMGLTLILLVSGMAFGQNPDKKPKAKKAMGKTCGKECSKKKSGEKA